MQDAPMLPLRGAEKVTKGMTIDDMRRISLLDDQHIEELLIHRPESYFDPLSLRLR